MHSKLAALSISTIAILAIVWIFLRDDDSIDLPTDRLSSIAIAPDSDAGDVRRSKDVVAPIRNRPAIPPELRGCSTIGLEFRFDDGAPVSEARVVLAAEGVDPIVTATDEEGRLTVPVHFADSWIAVGPMNARPMFRKLVARSEKTRIEFARGASVAGRVVVEGGPARPAVTVLWTKGRIPVILSEIPDQILRNFRDVNFEPRTAVREVVAQVESDGRFEIFGLEPGEVGTLVARIDADPSTFSSSRQNEADCAVILPAEGIVLTIKHGRTLSGRVVRERDGSPIAGASIAVGFGKLPPIDVLSTTDDGRFVIDVPNDVKTLTIIATDPKFGTEKIVRFDGPWRPTIDFGDIVCPTFRPIDVVVKDSSDRPIRGAALAWCGVESSYIAATDADGKAQIAMCDARMLGVAKIGFATAFVEVSDPPTAPIEVKLREGTRLRVRLKPYSDAMTGDLRVSVSSPSGIFDTANGIADAATWSLLHREGSQATGGISLSGARERESSRWEKTTTIGDTAEFSFLKAQSVIVSVADVSYSEWRRVELVADCMNDVEFLIGEPSRRLRGYVRDETGRPVENAEVRLLDGSNRPPVYILTEANGEFASEKPFSRFADIVVDHADHVPIQMRSFEVPSDDRPIEIILAKAKPFFLTVLDVDGRPVGGARLLTLQRISGTEEPGRDGVYRFTRVPTGPTKFLIEVGFGEYAFDADTAAGSATFRLPPLGKIELTWDFDLPRSGSMSATLRRVGSRGKPIEIKISAKDAVAGGRVLFEQLPAAAFEVEIVENRSGARGTTSASTTAVVQVSIGETSQATVSRRL